MAGRGKPCGASHISAIKTCRVSLGPEVNRALAAASGQIGAATLKEAVKKYAGAGGVNRLREIRFEVRQEMGGNIVKGPKADELKRRLQEEGLLPAGKAKSLDAGALFQKQVQEKGKSVPPELKEQLKQLAGKAETQTAPPDPKYGGLADDQLKNRLEAARAIGGKDWSRAQQIEKELKRRGIDPDAKSEPRPKGMGKWDMDQMKRIDADVVANTTAREGKSGYDWNDSLGKDAKVLGAGMYGTAILGKNGDVVKRGEIGPNEAKIIQKVGDLDLGPKLVSAELDGPGNYDSKNSLGRIAMSKVDGEPIGGKRGVEVSNAYWDARAKLHRAGVAHNDMHIDNVMVGRDGKGRFVDMGMAQDNPKAALAEAMGVFSTPIRGTVVTLRRDSQGAGDWQARRFENIGGTSIERYERGRREDDFRRLQSEHPNASRVYENRGAAIIRMKRMGLTDQEITDVMTHGIRSTDSSFEKGAMGKLTNDQAKEVIEVLYDGI